VSVHYARGDDPTLREAALRGLIDDLLAGDDRSLALEEHLVPGRAAEGDVPGGAEGRALAVAAALNGAQSPPFMTGRRIVVVRDAGNLAAGDAEPIVDYLGEQLETTELVLVAGGGRLPANLTKAWKGVVHDESVSAAGVDLDRDAAKRVQTHLGENAGRIPQLVAILDATFDAGTVLTADDVEPYLGGVGAVPGYQLTNAIEQGDVPGALATLQRMLTAAGVREGKPMHPLQVLGLLQSHFRRLLRLDDPDIGSPAQAVDALGGRVKEYPAKKALAQARALGTDGIRRAFDLLHQADLDLKGARAIPEDAVMEVLVARLAQLSKRAGAGRGRGR